PAGFEPATLGLGNVRAIPLERALRRLGSARSVGRPTARPSGGARGPRRRNARCRAPVLLLGKWRLAHRKGADGFHRVARGRGILLARRASEGACFESFRAFKKALAGASG